MLIDVVPVWLRRVAVHQDYAWFVVLVVWAVVVLVSWRHPQRGQRWGWLPALGMMAIGSTAVQFMIFDPTFDWFQDRLVPGTTNVYEPALIPVELLGDFLMVLGWAAVAAWWWWRALAGWWRWLGLAAAAGAGAWALGAPEGGSLALAAVVGLGAFLQGRHAPRGVSRWGLAAGAAMMGLSTVGPLAVWTGGGQREAAATVWGLGAAVFYGMVGVGLMVVVGREVLRETEELIDAEEAVQRRREWWLFGTLAAVWLGLGVGYAHQMGLDNRLELQRHRLRAVAAEAMVFPREPLADLVDVRWQLERVEVSPLDREPRALRAPWLDSVAAQALREQLAQVVMETPFLDRARILVIRDGLLIELASSQLPRESSFVRVEREATAADRAAWARAEPYIERDVVGEIGDAYFCRAPILTRDGQVLGWLDYVRQEFFQSLERKWRVGPLTVIALGLVAGFVVVLQRRSVRAQQRAWRRAAAETEANRLKSTFLAKVSHELRTPLQSLLGYSELLEREASDAVQRARLGRLREHGDLLLRIVNDLLDLSAMEAGRLQLVEAPVELDRLVEKTVTSLAAQAEAKGLSLEWEVADELKGRWCLADAVRVQQVVYNLVGNAVKFTDVGRVVARLRAAEAGRIRLEVEDSGPGVKLEDQARLFSAFARLDAAALQEGTGLGLAMVAALSRRMGGDAGVTSDGVAGAVFWSEWSLEVVPPPAFERGVESPEMLASLRGKRVLVAEDNPLVAELFQAVLAERGARCEWVPDGELAWQRLLAEAFDAVVLDLALPRLSGMEVARRLRAPGAGSRSVRVVGVSAHASQQDQMEALAAGMDVFLSKPVRLAELCAALAGPTKDGRRSAAPFEDPVSRARARLEGIFRRDARRQWEDVRDAVKVGDPLRVRRAAHYLANSAGVVEDVALLTLCRRLESVAEAVAPREAVSRELEGAMQRWLADGASEG
ncbi:hybrid sensor histidine kinase/response regulator [Actomonas aquatica]|uniref:histidine kinase n=1 Tax=Actomonas aquatica TaxID=2866162 RepID=A0ABZ1C389_9BACT|nr:response regulator [Opitutus sp. WL0086]WRQ86172.1 response regulator [Opitutus sp. WL0086]